MSVAWTRWSEDASRRAARTFGASGLVLVGAAALLQGCTGASPLDVGGRARLEREENWRSGAAWPTTDDVAEEVQPESAEAYVKLALARNPSIQAAEARVRRLSQRSAQARSLDDPMLMVAPFGEMAQTASGEVTVMTTLSQRLPLPDKLEARERIAELETAQAEAELEQVRLQVVGDVRRAYWTYLFAHQAIETTQQSRGLLAQLRDVADAQLRSGQRGQQDVLRAAAELANLDAELRVLAQRRETAAAMLRQLLDAPPSQVLPAPAPPDSRQVELERDALLERAVRANPGLQRASSRLAQFQQQQRLARLNRWPDLTLSVSYNVVENEGLSAVANGDDQWWIGFGVNLPIWAGKYNAAEREAVFGRLEAASGLAAERNRVLFGVEEALLRLESQREVLRLLREQVIPDARAAVEAAAAGYRAGTGDFLMLVDNWRQLLGYEVMAHQAAASVEQALADLEQAVGGAIEAEAEEPAEADPETTPGVVTEEVDQ